MIKLWISGVMKRRLGRMAGTVAGVTITAALLATLAIFLVGSSVTMTERAVGAVPIDWQVELVPAADPTAIRAAIGKAADVRALAQVNYAQIGGLEASTGGTVQTTGPGKAIAFSAGYRKDFPKEVRPLLGTADGALLAQQTAANLHAGPGDTVTIKRVGLDPATVTVTGVVDLPDADSLFQGVGLPPQAAPQAPPDNVIILPPADWHRVFDPQTAARPDSTRLQFHVRLNHAELSSRPTDAFLQVAGAAKNLEARVAGQALVSNNLGARLDAVRGDSLYATVLFLFLGIPGIALATALTLSVAAAGAGRRQAELALLRARGASLRQVMMLVGTEAAIIAVVGVGLGLALASGFGKLAALSAGPWASAAWTFAFVALAGVLLTGLAVIVPAWRIVSGNTVAAARRSVKRTTAPFWQRYELDVILLALSGFAFWQLASTGYQIVLAPEGVPATAVDYKAFIAPALFWIGAGLFTLRLSNLVIGSNSPVLRGLISPVTGRLTSVVASSLAIQSRRLTVGLAMTALAISFATSTAIFNTTYNGQARVDAELTNGADVTVFGTSAHPASPDIGRIAKLPGVAAVEPLQHRFAYVGSDMQDMYGIDPQRIANATSLSDAYFRGGTAQQILDRLAATPDGVLVSEETVKDFQLNPGDTVNLRMINASDNQYHTVAFKFIGVAREFPTAPKDSFLVANADYIAKATGSANAEYALIRAVGDPARLAEVVRNSLADAPGLQVKDIGTVAHIIGSSLTAVDLSSLTRIELTFAVIMAAAAAGLMLALGFMDRRRNFAILKVIGAKPAQMAGFLWAEGILVAAGGIAFGMASGIATAWMLVKLLTGVFDPPPEALAIPWAYVAGTLGLMIASIVAAVLVTSARSDRAAVETLRDL